MNAEPKNGYLQRKTFFWVMGIFIMLTVTVMGYVVGKQDKLSETFNHNVSEIRVNVAKLQTGQDFILEYIRSEK